MSSNHVQADDVVRQLKYGLPNFWQPVLLSEDLPPGMPVGLVRLGRHLVAWRDDQGAPHVWRDRCPHRGTRLSLGDVVDGRLQCRYHGLQFDGAGQCRVVPSEQCEDGPAARRTRAVTYPAEERGGFVYAYIGDVDLFPPPPLVVDDELTSERYVRVFRQMVWQANWQLVRDNTPDPAHLPFLHGRFAPRVNEDGTFAVEPIGTTQNPVMTPDYVLEVLSGRSRLVDTDTGIALYASDDQRPDVVWELPALAKVRVPLDPETTCMHYQYEVPIDESSTAVFIALSIRCDDPAARAELQVKLETEIYPFVFEMTFEEDSWILNAMGDVDETRADEHLLPSDAPMLRIRRRIERTFREQQVAIRSRSAN